MSIVDLMVEHCIELGGDHKLPGVEGKSPIFVRLRPLSYDPEKCIQVLEACLDRLGYFDVLLGIRNSGAIWGLPLALWAYNREGLTKNFVEIAPEHLRAQVEQPGTKTPLDRDKRYVLFDNFVTTGFSIDQCHNYCRSKKLPEECVIPFTIFSYGIVDVNALVTLDQLLQRAEKTGRLTQGQVSYIQNWKENTRFNVANAKKKE